ncbi:MAG: hypothetical protein ACOCTR_02280 [Candidatus Natronoplasma sp.]
MKEADRIEKKLESLMKSLEEGVEEDPEAHKRLLKLGEEISDKSDVGEKAVDEFLKERRSLWSR